LRLFVAINFADEVRESVHAATTLLRQSHPDLRWVAPHRLHLTVRFLGEMPETIVEPLGDQLRDAALRNRSVPLTLGTIGAFPGFKRPHVIWLGVEYEPKLELLYHDVELACMALGMDAEGRPFRPHVTLARVPHRLPEQQARDLQRTARGIRLRVHAEVRSVDLMQSRSAAAGPEYTILRSAPLRADS
jgi:RNA 2',3'-cyclic 3'-phosphodiesterase